jgi:hypothetical protein
MSTGTERLNALTRLRRDQERTVAFVLAKDELLGMKMLGCGTWLHFREWMDHGGEARLLHANFCKKHTLCRVCSARRSVKLVEAYEPKVAGLMQESPALIPAMVSLTLQSGFDLAERLGHFRESWSAMTAAKRKADSNPDKNALIQWNRVEGSLRSIEATYNAEKGWHVHGHVFALLTAYMDKRQLSEEWHRFTGDSMITDVRKCYGESRAALHEVIKYACKFSDLTDERLWEFHQGVNGGRMFDSAGSLRGIKTGELDQDSIEGLTGPYRDWVATWLWMEKKYHIQEGFPTRGMYHGHASSVR